MWNVKSWIWPGLVSIAAITLGAVWFEMPRVASEIGERARATLAAELSWAEVAVHGRDVILTGSAPSEAAQQAALDRVSAVDGVRSVADEMGLLPQENPYRFSVAKSDSGIVLSGFAPSLEARDRLKAQIGRTLPGIEIADDLSLARGAPDSFKQLVTFGLTQLSRLGEGGFEIVDSRISVHGQALSSADFAALYADAKEGGEIIGRFEVTPPEMTAPYVFKLSKTAGQTVVTGYVPSLAMRSEVAAALGKGAEVELDVATGVPEGLDWEAATQQALEAASWLAEGEVEIAAGRLNVNGDARDAAAFRELQQMINSELPGGLALGATDIGVAAADRNQAADENR